MTSKPRSELLYAKIVTGDFLAGKMHRVNARKFRKWRHQRSMWTNAQECQLQTAGFLHYWTMYFLKKIIPKVNLSPHKNLFFQKNSRLTFMQKNATLQHSETVNCSGKLLV